MSDITLETSEFSALNILVEDLLVPIKTNAFGNKIYL